MRCDEQYEAKVAKFEAKVAKFVRFTFPKARNDFSVCLMEQFFVDRVQDV